MRERIVAHRGNAAEFRENSIAAIASAIDLGCKFVEFDVRLSRDGVPVLLHDCYLTRLTGKDREACSTLFGDLQSYGIDPLSDAAALLRRAAGVQAFVEIKADGVDDIERVVELVCRQLDPDLFTIISFSVDACLKARALGFRIGLVIKDLSYREACEAIKPDYVFCDQRKIHEMVWPGSTWCAYEVADLGTAVRLTDCGVTLLETMQVRKLLRC